MKEKPMTLNDGTFLYTDDMVIEHLTSLGYDLDQLCSVLMHTGHGDDEYVKVGCIDDYEYMYSELECQVRSTYDNIEELCKKLASGKGGTKVQYADRIKKAFFEGIEVL